MKLRVSKHNFFYLTILSFVFVSSFAMAVSKSVPRILDFVPVVVAQEKHFPPVPVLKEVYDYPILSSQGVIAIDLSTGISLYEKNPDKTLLPASTTKIITALVAMDNYPLDEIITVPQVRIDGQKMGLFAGEQMKFEDLLYGLLVYSANDAAEVLAASFPGGRNAFVAQMNTKAKELHMKNSNFQNPVGLDSDVQMTTARDLVRASEVAMRNQVFAKIVSTKDYVVTDVSGRYKHYLKNINELLGNTPGVLGIKTGWTENARENLVTYMERDDHKIIIVVLGSQDRFGETKELIDWIFNNYEWQEVKVAIQKS